MKLYTLRKLILLLSTCLSTLFAQNYTLKMPSIFGDNMVLQQNTKVAFWGNAEPGSDIFVQGSWGYEVNAVVSSDGKWITYLQTISADESQSFEVKISSKGESLVFRNILFGEVWLCSGQSNMEMPLRGWPPQDLIVGSEEAISNSTNNFIRFFTVERSVNIQPIDDCKGEWVQSNPETAAGFSATAYFFGKKLYDELKIPIGLVHSSWGGTPAEAWTSKNKLKTINEFSKIENDLLTINESKGELDNWLKHFSSINMMEFLKNNSWKDVVLKDESVKQENYDDSKWPVMELPIQFEETEMGAFNGAVWFRKTIEIPSDWINKEITLSLGPIDDMDATYVNGVKIGGYEEAGFWQVDRVYKIHRNMIKSTKISAAVRVIDTQGGGGIYGKPDKLFLQKDERIISLAGDWKYLAVGEYINSEFFVFGSEGEKYLSRPKMKYQLNENTPSVLFNGMINPLIPYGIRGVIWYQGEANTGAANLYHELFSKMIEDWRGNFGIGDFPFYFVQIAPWNYHGTSQYLREAQFKTSKTLVNTGMAVTLDIGNFENIHPANKKDVGYRLAFHALKNTYDKQISYSGPVYKYHSIVGDKIMLYFDCIEEGLIVRNKGQGNEFIIAGADRKFYPAEITIDGNRIICFSKKVKFPKSVRYAWSDMPIATLFNSADLPASSFRTDNW